MAEHKKQSLGVAETLAESPVAREPLHSGPGRAAGGGDDREGVDRGGIDQGGVDRDGAEWNGGGRRRAPRRDGALGRRRRPARPGRRDREPASHSCSARGRQAQRGRRARPGPASLDDSPDRALPAILRWDKRVDWRRLSPTALQRLLGYGPAHCLEKREFEAGQRAALRTAGGGKANRRTGRVASLQLRQDRDAEDNQPLSFRLGLRLAPSVRSAIPSSVVSCRAVSPPRVQPGRAPADSGVASGGTGGAA